MTNRSKTRKRRQQRARAKHKAKAQAQADMRDLLDRLERAPATFVTYGAWFNTGNGRA